MVLPKKRRQRSGHLLTVSMLKFNVDEVARGKPGPAGTGGILRNFEGQTWLTFSKSVGAKDYMEAKVIVILRISLQAFQGWWMVEGEQVTFSNAIQQVASEVGGLKNSNST